MAHAETFLARIARIAGEVPSSAIEAIASGLAALRERHGRLFVLGVGGGAANAGHAVNDFRKLCGIEAYAPTDNVAELTARTNDEGWDTVFVEWLKVSRARAGDALLILSVGGGDAERKVSVNLVRGLDFAKQLGMTVFGIVGRQGGHTAEVGDHVVVVPTVDAALVTPLTEAWQAVVWHCLVSHPLLQLSKTKW
jgi:D-sedoheptulose 7-phosphate isomerase